MTKKVNTWWNNRTTIKSPCMNCQDRTSTCHGPSCERYSKYQVFIREYNEEINNKRVGRKRVFK